MGRGIGTFPLDILGLMTPPEFAPGTGIIPLNKNATEIYEVIPDVIVKRVVTQMNGLFGDYPDESDLAPCILFMILYLIISGGHLVIFIRNTQRGHKFLLSLGLCGYALFRVIGFGLRIAWSKDVLNISMGIASTVFCQVPVLLLNVMTMFMAHRIFTWRHPQTGRATWFRAFNIQLYVMVIGVIIMAILGTSIPYIYYLDEEHFKMCQKAAQAAGCLQVAYAMGGVIVIALAWSVKPGKIDSRLFNVPEKRPEEYPATLQPYWIDHFRPLYYVNPKEIKTASHGVIPVIASREKPANGLSRPQNPHRHHHPSIYTSIAIVIGSCLTLTFCCCFRLATLFIIRPRGGYGAPFGHFTYRNIVFYVLYGALELLVNIMLMVTRVDLRFYAPDKKAGERGVTDTQPPTGQIESFLRIGGEEKDKKIKEDNVSEELQAGSEYRENSTENLRGSDEQKIEERDIA
ncbi:hypothetical protein TRICI_002464 [Trichomonascus ciferrii]|uniref:Uncharacterized protein n=1 Tax=Trichomonascus ciferrii TaxID=44093 RepID=A0A642V6I7_9ASCO|nr:hypothetical protein TRICI_002464 [Trichomonascus ciferrii]